MRAISILCSWEGLALSKLIFRVNSLIRKQIFSNNVYPCQLIDMEIPHGSRDHVIEPDTVKNTFNLTIESAGKLCSIIENAGRPLRKKKQSKQNLCNPQPRYL